MHSKDVNLLFRLFVYMYKAIFYIAVPGGGHSNNGVVHMRDQRNMKKKVVF